MTNETTGIEKRTWTGYYNGMSNARFTRYQIGAYIAIRVEMLVSFRIEVYVTDDTGIECYLGLAPEVCVHSGDMSHVINLALPVGASMHHHVAI